MTANTVSGDVGIGIPIAPGAEKRIVWQSGHDLERIDIENLRFRIVLVPWPRLIVLTDPSGVSVSVDGTGRGETPLAVADLPPGDHAVILTLDGFLENSQVVTLTSGEEETVQVTLTSAGASQPVVESEEGGSNRLVLILAGVGGAVGAVALAGGGGEPAASGGVAVSGADPINPLLRVLKGGSGSGRIRSDPPGINCGNDCTERYPAGSTVLLTAIPDVGSGYAGFLVGQGCSQVSQTTVQATMVNDITCNFIFDLSGPATPIQLSPPDGTIFNIFPRTTTLTWRSGLAEPPLETYTVQISHRDSSGWNDAPPVSGLFTESYTFDFVGAQPGRWRVWAVFDGRESAKTGWWEFTYTR
jgi:hypothetical protein